MNYKIIIWLGVVLLSIILIGPNFNPHGMKITHLNSSMDYGSLKRGDVIFRVGDDDVNQDVLNKPYFNIVKLDTSRGVVYIRANGTLGIRAEPVGRTNLNLGLDLKGGTRAIIEPVNATTPLSEIITTLQTRINIYGLRESNFRPVYFENRGFIEITMAGGNEDELRQLLQKQGFFEAKINFLTNNLVLDKNYPIHIINDSIEIDNRIIHKGESFKLEDISFTLENIVPGKANLTSTVFDSKDVELVFRDPQRSYIQRQKNGYRWAFGIQIGTEGAKRFAKITNNLDRRFDQLSGDKYLSSKISLYLDGRLIDSLNIAASLKGMEETNPQITGGADTYAEALKTKQQLQTILSSGSLPTKIKISEMNVVSPRLGTEFVKNIFYAAVAAVAALSFVVFVRYRKIKIIVPMIIVSITELIIVLGMSVLIGWTIDLAAIAGLIAAIGTGVDDQLVILDGAVRKEEISLKRKIKRAFFIVFGSAGTLVAAMLPLMVIGFGLLRGFAITTMVGVFVGVFITRPAFAVIVEKIVNSK